MNHFALVFLAIAVSSTAPNSSRSAPLEEEHAAISTGSEEAGVPILTFLKAVAKKTGKKIIVDSRVRGNVQLLGEDVSNVTYSDLLTILQIQGYTAVEGGGFLRVIPDAIVRQSALPLIVGTTTYPDAQYVSAVIAVHRMPAASLIPILRP